MGNSFSTSVVVVDGRVWRGGQVCAHHPLGHHFEASLWKIWEKFHALDLADAGSLCTGSGFFFFSFYECIVVIKSIYGHTMLIPDPWVLGTSYLFFILSEVGLESLDAYTK